MEATVEKELAQLSAFSSNAREALAKREFRIEVPMGKLNGPYKADFPLGTRVRIKSRAFLEEFQRTWKFHDPLKDFQLDCAGQIGTVSWFGYYFGADELYALEGIPGIWNEPCLEPLENSN
jgi:hypothetical protein